jgi:hypothetical protein
MSMSEQDESVKHRQLSVTKQLEMKTRPSSRTRGEKSRALRQDFGGEELVRRSALAIVGTHGEVLARIFSVVD